MVDATILASVTGRPASPMASNANRNGSRQPNCRPRGWGRTDGIVSGWQSGLNMRMTQFRDVSSSRGLGNRPFKRLDLSGHTGALLVQGTQDVAGYHSGMMDKDDAEGLMCRFALAPYYRRAANWGQHAARVLLPGQRDHPIRPFFQSRHRFVPLGDAEQDRRLLGAR